MSDELLSLLTCDGCRAMPDRLGNGVVFSSTSPRFTAQERAEVERFQEVARSSGIVVRVGECGRGEASSRHDQITVLGSNGTGSAHIFRPSGTARFLVVDLLNAAQVTQHRTMAEAFVSAAEHVRSDFTAMAA